IGIVKSAKVIEGLNLASFIQLRQLETFCSELTRCWHSSIINRLVKNPNSSFKGRQRKSTKEPLSPDDFTLSSHVLLTVFAEFFPLFPVRGFVVEEIDWFLATFFSPVRLAEQLDQLFASFILLQLVW